MLNNVLAWINVDSGQQSGLSMYMQVNESKNGCFLMGNTPQCSTLLQGWNFPSK